MSDHREYYLSQSGPTTGRWVCTCGADLGDQPIDEIEDAFKEHVLTQQEAGSGAQPPASTGAPQPVLAGTPQVEANDLLQTTDSTKWAAAWCEIARRNGHRDIDEGWMITWFANAIETGRSFGERAASPVPPNAVEELRIRLDEQAEHNCVTPQAWRARKNELHAKLEAALCAASGKEQSK